MQVVSVAYPCISDTVAVAVATVLYNVCKSLKLLLTMSLTEAESGVLYAVVLLGELNI